LSRIPKPKLGFYPKHRKKKKNQMWEDNVFLLRKYKQVIPDHFSLIIIKKTAAEIGYRSIPIILAIQEVEASNCKSNNRMGKVSETLCKIPKFK
jgi:hypothetical protein